MEDLPFGRIAALVPEFAVKDLLLGRTLMMMSYNNIHGHMVLYTYLLNSVVLALPLFYLGYTNFTSHTVFFINYINSLKL